MVAIGSITGYPWYKIIAHNFSTSPITFPQLCYLFFSNYVHLLYRTTTQRRLLHPKDQQVPASSNHTSGKKPHFHPSSKSTGLESATTKPYLLPRWAIYTLAVSGAVCFVVVVTSMYLLLSRRKKDKTVMPWATGLSGQLSKVFVTGHFLII